MKVESLNEQIFSQGMGASHALKNKWEKCSRKPQEKLTILSIYSTICSSGVHDSDAGGGWSRGRAREAGALLLRGKLCAHLALCGYQHFPPQHLASNQQAISNYDFNSIIGSNVKLIVTKKQDYARFDHFVDKLYQCNLIDLKIIEDLSEFEDEALDENIDLEDTMTLLKEYVNAVETDLDKQRIKNLLQTLYIEAQDTA